MNTTTINGGRYYVVDEIKNLALPSVTTILGADSPDKDFFIEWAKRVGPVKAVFGANRGTFMHALHEHYIDAIYIKQIAKPLQYATTFVLLALTFILNFTAIFMRSKIRAKAARE